MLSLPAGRFYKRLVSLTGLPIGPRRITLPSEVRTERLMQAARNHEPIGLASKLVSASATLNGLHEHAITTILGTIIALFQK